MDKNALFYDENGNLVGFEDLDLENGYLEETTEEVDHPAIEPVEEIFHYVYFEYPNGGRDEIKVIDTPGTPGREAWTEIVTAYHYIPYTDETRPKPEPSLDERVATVEDTTAELQEALSMILSGVTEA